MSSIVSNISAFIKCNIKYNCNSGNIVISSNIVINNCNLITIVIK